MCARVDPHPPCEMHSEVENETPHPLSSTDGIRNQNLSDRDSSDLEGKETSFPAFSQINIAATH